VSGESGVGGTDPAAGGPGETGGDALLPFEYAVLRAVPRIDRGEAINIGVVLYCQARDYLGCGIHLDPQRLLTLDPQADVVAVDAALSGVLAVCAGDRAAGAAATATPRARFGWLTAPRSTVVQPGPVHPGLTRDPAAKLAHLLEQLVK
jgi:hypothetical protein